MPESKCFPTGQLKLSFSFVRRLPYRAGVKNLDVARWAGVEQS